MSKIPFNIKYRPQIESGEYTVETRDGVHATILEWDIFIHGMAHMMLIRYNDKYEFVHSNGRINRTGQDCNLDLFIVMPEEELTEFEIRLLDWLSNDTSGEIPMERMKELSRNRAAELLGLARKEIQEEFIKSVAESAYDKGQEDGKAEALKELSGGVRWRRIDKSPDFAESGEKLLENGVRLYKNINAYMVVGLSKDGVLSWICNHECDSYRGDGYYLTFDDLLSLPKEG